MGYQLDGQILEVCDCNVLCPCWIGEDPDGGTCDSVEAYHVERGTINGVDVSGLTFGVASFIPGNILQGNIRVVFLVDDKATPEQQEMLLAVFTGKLGGPIADLAQLFSEIVAVERVPVSFDIVDGEGRLTMGDVVEAEMAPYRGPTGEVTTLHDTIISTIPGSPAYVAKASVYQRNTSQYGLKDVNLTGHNAIQGPFHFEA